MSRLSATQQKKYLGTLRGAKRAAREAEILYRREHRSDEPFVTDEGQPTKRSKHAAAFERKYGRAPKDTADAARLSGVPKKVLDEVYARGMAAWQTGHRPGASQHAWAMARVESFLTGGPTSKTADADLAREAKLKNPDWLAKIDQLFDTTPASGIVKRPSDGASNRTQEWKRQLKEQRVFSFPAQVAWIRDNTNFPDPEGWVRAHMSAQKLTDEELAEKTKQDAEFNSEHGLSPSKFFRLDPSWSPAKGGPARWVPDPEKLPAGYTIERANPADATHVPPGPVAAAARRGLELRAGQPTSNRCCTSVGLRRAAQLANRQPVSEDTMRRMLSYFQRHEVDKKGKDWNKGTSKGLQAWLCWGGDEGYAWVRRVLGA